MHLHVPRSVPDDADFDDLPEPARCYGGHPSPLAGEWSRVVAMAMIKASRPCSEIAILLGYQAQSAFSDAFKRFTGMRPSVFALSIGAPKPKRREGRRSLGERKPRLTGAKPLPRFDAKPKSKKKRKPKKRVA